MSPISVPMKDAITNNTPLLISDPTKIIQKEYLVKGTIVFIMMTLATFLTLFILNDLGTFLDLLYQINFSFLSIIFLLVAIDLILDTYRYHIIAKSLNPNIKFKLMFAANMADSFGSAVTPFQIGGGAAMIYILKRGGISLVHGLSVCITTFIISMLIILVSSTVSVFILQDHFSNHLLDNLLYYGLLSFLVVFILIFLSLIKPNLFLSKINSLISNRNNNPRSYLVGLFKLGLRLITAGKEYNLIFTQLIKSHPVSLFISFIVTILYYLNRFLIAYFLVVALGGNISFIKIISLQSLVLLLSYFAPTPGGSGITELSINALMLKYLDGAQLFSFICFYRFLLFYFYVIIGSFVIFKDLHIRGNRFNNKSISTDGVS
jgi:uncharacterized protein (TIRG00374 family)